MNELQLSQNIEVITAEINAYQRVAGEAIFEIGRRLKHVKENDLAHGEFTEWVEKEVGISYRQANRFIKVVDELEESNVVTQSLGLRTMYEIATLPKEEREKEHKLSDGSFKRVENMTIKQLRELKKKTVRNKQTSSKKRAIKNGRNKCEICEFDCKAILQIHHIVPVRNGGDNSNENIAILCPNCHSMLHIFLSDKAEKEIGLDYIVDWMNDNFNSEEIGKIRELWNGMLENKEREYV